MSRVSTRATGVGGPRLVAASATAVGLLCAALLLTGGSGDESIGRVARVTARVALLFFVVAYAASPLRRLWRRPASAWLLRNRRYVGLSFAVAMGFHALAILALALRLGPGFEIDPISFTGGSLAYAFTALQAATSSDRAYAALGPARWRALHRGGMHAIWIVFAVTELPVALDSPLHFALAALLVAAAGLRAGAALARRRAPGLASPA